MINTKISDAWRKAAADLGIHVIAPITLTGTGGQEMQFEAQVLDFGAPGGAIVMSKRSKQPRRALGDGRWYSILFESYEKYDRRYFIDTLNDWQWFGAKGAAPPWYTGAPWS